MYSTGNCIQYLKVTYNGTESKKEDIQIYITDFAEYLKHRKSAMPQLKKSKKINKYECTKTRDYYADAKNCVYS